MVFLMEEENGIKSKNKDRKEEGKIKVLFILNIVVLIVIGIFYVANNKKKDNLEGNWSVDGITFFEFDGKGNGKLKVPTDEYKFSYTISHNEVYLDYESDKATDSDYEYSFDGNKLVFKGIKATTGTYTLTKQ